MLIFFENKKPRRDFLQGLYCLDVVYFTEFTTALNASG